MTKKGLLISYAFPPVAVPESWVTAKVMGNIPGWEFDVVSVDPFEAEMAEDHCLEEYVQDRFGSVKRVEPPMYLRPLGGRFPCRFFPSACQRPDRLRFYNGKMVKAARALDPSSYDVIVSRSQWHSSHLVAAELKGVYPDIPWAACFSDPWAFNPNRQLGKKLEQFHQVAERMVIEAANAVIFPSARLRKAVMSKYNEDDASKAHLIHHSFDPGLYGSVQRSEQDVDKKVIRYLGSFYGMRSPEPVFQALSLLMDEDAEVISGLRLELVGSIPEPFLQTESAKKVSDYIRVREPVSYIESLKLMQDADALLIVDAPAEDSFFLPSKLVDYLGADRPVLGVTPPGESFDLVGRIGGVTADPSDIRSVAEAIGRTMKRIRERGSRESAGNTEVTQEYTVARVGESLRVVLDEICGSDG